MGDPTPAGGGLDINPTPAGRGLLTSTLNLDPKPYCPRVPSTALGDPWAEEGGHAPPLTPPETNRLGPTSTPSIDLNPTSGVIDLNPTSHYKWAIVRPGYSTPHYFNGEPDYHVGGLYTVFIRGKPYVCRRGDVIFTLGK